MVAQVFRKSSHVFGALSNKDYITLSNKELKKLIIDDLVYNPKIRIIAINEYFMLFMTCSSNCL